MTPYSPKALGANVSPFPQLSAASLPAELRRIIDRVLKRSRLWPSERADVEAELASHFADGLASGLSVEKLIEDFGDPDAASSLIRRAKLRGRSRTWHAWRLARNATLATVSLLVFSYVFITVRFFVGTPTITRDIRKELNAPIVAIPQNQRAWPTYKQAYAALFTPELDNTAGASASRSQVYGALDKPEDARRNQAAISLLRKAASFPNFGVELDNPQDYEFLSRHQLRLAGTKDWETRKIDQPARDGPAVQIVLQHLGVMRSFARLLMQDVDLAIEAGNSAAVSEDLVAGAQMAVHSRESPFLISDLVSLAIGDLVMSKVREVLTRNPDLLTDQSLRQIASALRAIGPRQQLVRFDGELLSFEDILQRSFTDSGNGNGDGRLTPAGIRILAQLSQFNGEGPQSGAGEIAAFPVASSIGPGRKALHDTYVSMMTQVKQWEQIPRWIRPTPPDPETIKQGTFPLSPYSFISLMMPAFNNSVHAADRFDASREATLTIIALEQFKRANGRFPASLSELVPSFLPSIPLDIADGQPLRYKPSGGSYTLYSLGANLIDDGGKPAETSSKESQVSNFRPMGIDFSKIHDDWVFFPYRAFPKDQPRN